MNQNMIYEFRTHSINLERRYEHPTFSLTIGTLELVIDCSTKKILYVQGFLPLIKALNSKIILPKTQEGDYYFDSIHGLEIRKFDVFSLEKIFPKCKEYFSKSPIVFDKDNGIIQLGCIDNGNVTYLAINDNLIIGQDGEDVIQCIYIIPDKFV